MSEGGKDVSRARELVFDYLTVLDARIHRESNKWIAFIGEPHEIVADVVASRAFVQATRLSETLIVPPPSLAGGLLKKEKRRAESTAD